MDSQLNKPLTTASPLDKGLHEPLLKKEPLNKPYTTPSDTLLAGQSSAAGGILPAATVTYTESKLEPIITIKEVTTSTPIISTSLQSTTASSTLLPGEKKFKSESPVLDLERGLNKPVLGEKSPKLESELGSKSYERKLDTHLDQKLEGPALSRQAGSELMGNSGETKRLSPVEPTPYPTAVGTGTVGMMPGAEVPANLGATPVTTGTSSSVYPTSHSTGITTIDERAHSPSRLTTVTEDVKVSKHHKHHEHVHHEKTHKHVHHDKLSHEEKKNMSNEEKYILHEREADVADAEGKGLKAAFEDVKAGYRKTEAETDVKEVKPHKHHKHGHKKDKTIV